MRRVLAIGTVALALAVSGCGGGSQKATSESGRTLDPATRLVDLEHPKRSPDLFSLFNAGQGQPRLVLLMSPT